MDPVTQKILLVTLQFPPGTGGVQRYLWELSQRIPEIFVVAPFPSDPSDRPDKVMRERFFYRLSWPRWLRIFYILYRMIGVHNVRMILVNDPLPLGIVALLLHWLRRVRFIVFTHGLDIAFPLKHPWKKSLLMLVLRMSHLVIANSQFTASLLNKYRTPKSKIHVIMPAVGKAFFAPVPSEMQTTVAKKYQIPQESVRIISVGRLVKRKNHSLMLRSFAQISTDADAVYLIVGTGPEMPHLQELARHLGVSDKVIFTGEVSDDELHALYAQSDIFMLTPSAGDTTGDVEGFGIVLQEAQAHGVAVVASRTGGIAESCGGDQSAILVTPGVQHEITEALRKLIRDPKERLRIANAGHTWASKSSWEQSASQLRHLLFSSNL